VFGGFGVLVVFVAIVDKICYLPFFWVLFGFFLGFLWVFLCFFFCFFVFFFFFFFFSSLLLWEVFQGGGIVGEGGCRGKGSIKAIEDVVRSFREEYITTPLKHLYHMLWIDLPLHSA
jgi:hypothetical protein